MIYTHAVSHYPQDMSGSEVEGETYLAERSVKCYVETIPSQAARESWGLDSSTDMLMLTKDGTIELGDRIVYHGLYYMVRGKAVRDAHHLLTHVEYHLERT